VKEKCLRIPPFAVALVVSWSLAACTNLEHKQIGPYAQCRWEYKNGIEALKNSATNAGFDPTFNPFITVSRQGLTARVIGVLSDKTLQRFGGRLDQVIAAYPYLTPVRYVATHEVSAEDIARDAEWRANHPAGEVESTTVIEWPINTVMIIYPVSIAAPGFNTAAGNWRIESKNVSRPNDQMGDFGKFPFLRYTYQGHAFHGPTTGDRESDVWALSRGRVSHGCNRMEGEHIVELSALLGCPASGRGVCSAANERVTVMEEFDYVPDPLVGPHRTGKVDDLAEIYRNWVVVDVANFPRDASAPLPPGVRYSDQAVMLMHTQHKAWRESVPGISNSSKATATTGIARVRAFETWDNLENDVPGSSLQYVKGENCSD
jgi:hypothetical protein